MNDDDPQSVNDFMQKILPGSTSFPVKLLCPKCGWHFKAGFTDPSGRTREVVPNAAVVCGQCLALLRTNEQLQLEEMTRERLATATPEELEQLQRFWMMAYVALKLKGPEPKGTPQ